MRILLADDSEVSRILILRLLQKRGHEVITAASGLEVLALTEREAFDLVLLDVGLPQLDGFHAAARIREREGDSGSRLPMLALTTQDLEEERRQYQQAGFDAFLNRPFHTHELFAAVESAMSRSGAGIFDLTTALARMEGDRELLSTLVGLFLTRLDGVVEKLEAAVGEGDFGSLERSAHSLRGSAANFSARETVEAAAALERMARERDLAGARDSFVVLRAALQRLRGALTPLQRQA